MGRGDQKTKKGKRARGSYGNSRPKKASVTSTVIAEKPKKAKKEAAPKKTATKKKATTAKKTAKAEEK